AAHADAMRNEYVLRAAIGRIAGEFAEGALRLVHAREYFNLDADLRGGADFEIVDSGFRQPVGLAEQPANDLDLPPVRRIGIDHRTHVVQWMRADGDHRRQRLSLLLGATVILVHPPAGMQGDAESVFAL